MRELFVEETLLDSQTLIERFILIDQEFSGDFQDFGQETWLAEVYLNTVSKVSQEGVRGEIVLGTTSELGLSFT